MKNMIKKSLIPKVLIAVFALSGMAIFATTNQTVSRAFNIARPDVKVKISGEVKRDGKSLSLETVEAVKSGEILDWAIASVNDGAGDAQNYRVVGQIPAGTTFVAGSAKNEDGLEVTYSIDGGKTFTKQPVTDEKQMDGSVKQVIAPVSMYTQVRFVWAESLKTQGSLSATYQVQVK